MDRGRALWVPAVPLVPHLLDAHGAADRLRPHGRVDAGVTGVVAPIGAGAGYPDDVHRVLRQAGDPVACEMRLLRAGPRGLAIDALIDYGIGTSRSRDARLRDVVIGAVIAKARRRWTSRRRRLSS